MNKRKKESKDGQSGRKNLQKLDHKDPDQKLACKNIN
jgi:hypothetical protein